MSGKLASGGSTGKRADPDGSAEPDITTPCEADEESRPAARPVRVDEAGRIFEMSGERIVTQGLAPENILKGIEDERAGRLRSLDEYLASRHQHGL